MLKTNSKKVMEAMKEEVLSFYNLEDLKNNLNAVKYPPTNVIQYITAAAVWLKVDVSEFTTTI